MRLSNWLDWQLIVTAIFIAFIAILGTTSNSDYLIQILVLATIYAAVAASWSIAGGLGGLLLLGFISFYGVGAYTNGILLTKSPWINIFIAGGVAALLGWLIAAVTLRYELSEDYFAMFTVGVSQVLKILLLNSDYFGRATGIYITIVKDDWLMMAFVSRKPYLLIALALLLAVVVISYRIQRSKFGFRLAAVRQNSRAAEALGINPVKTKIQAIIIAGGLGGSIGAFYSQFVTFIDPKQVFSLATNFEMLLGAVLGGRLTIIGPVLGAAALKPLQDVLRGIFGGEADALYLVIYGALLIITCLTLPKGIAFYIEQFHKRRYGLTSKNSEARK
ncbi:MAG: branched-chain amino acid ABC transporter permease [Proteobacteria bacterium]|nr:branched-chain amino acid ABC transporter permease [Pseudomonadota bacterium]